MLKYDELVNQPKEELESQMVQLSKELFELRNELKVTRKVEKPHLFKQKKRDRARVMTALSQKRINNKEA